jgi:altronate hydrolase
MSPVGAEILCPQPDDNLVVARRDLPAGTGLPGGATLVEPLPAAHKAALRDIAAGETLRRAGLILGLAATPISAGARLRPSDIRPTSPVSLPAPATPHPIPPATFRGFVREDGRVGTRNFVGVIIASNCGASAARQAADWFDDERLASFPNVDGVVPLIHELGCGMEMTGEPMDLLRRTLSGAIRNPNLAGAVVVALGCERNNLKVFLEQERLAVGDRLRTVTIQEAGGIRAAIEAAKAHVEAMLPLADTARREDVPVSRLVVGLQTGAADGFCGFSANPALGAAVDLLIAQGGTAILSETPDLLLSGGAFTGRAADAAVAEALRTRLDWWQEYGRGRDVHANGRLDRAHEDGGLVSALEKAVDGLSKAGAAPLAAVHRYAERVSGPGLVFMDSPDYDPVSVTGQMAAGATLICMTTGTGSTFGSLPAPTIKIAASTEAFRRMADDTDLDAGPVLDGGVSVQEMGQRIFEAILRHASGERTRGEVEGMGESEFVPWPIGVFG